MNKRQRKKRNKLEMASEAFWAKAVVRHPSLGVDDSVALRERIDQDFREMIESYNKQASFTIFK